jgi:hypothetical protein
VYEEQAYGTFGTVSPPHLLLQTACHVAAETVLLEEKEKNDNVQ